MTQQLRHACAHMTARPVVGQASRYLAGGGACALLHNIIMIGTSAHGMPYPPALVLSLLLTTPIGYLIHSAYTFEKGCSWMSLRRFLAGIASGFVLSAALMVLMCSGLGMPVAIATPIATLLLFAWNFAVARWAILVGS
jgi:putative flippase GtrA